MGLDTTREAVRELSDSALVDELARRARSEVGEEEAKRLIAEARLQFGTPELEIDNNARFSVGDDGTWVQAWVWLHNAAGEA